MRTDVNVGDLVAVLLPPGPVWPRIVADIWETGAALLPVDHRLHEHEIEALLVRARPTVAIGTEGSRRVEGEPIDPETALVCATSGTGGDLKLAQLSWSAVEAAVGASNRALGAQRDDPWLSCLPLAHIGGILVLLRSILGGASVAVHSRFDPAQIEREPEVAFTSVVPTMVVRLLEAGADLGRFRGILVGGAALPRDVADRAEEEGIRLIATYGLTESCGGVVYDGIRLEGVKLRVGERSEIQLRGPMTMTGYRFDPEATDAAFTADGWLRTGDAGSLDEQGCLHVDGRIDDLILSGGEKVWPDEVEVALRDHAAVADVAVAGRPDPEWGARVVAFVVPADAQAPPTLEALRDHAGERLARHKAPRELVLLSHIPRTSSGKVRRSALGPFPQPADRTLRR